MAEIANVLSIPRALRLFQRKRVNANCIAGDLVGDCVYITGAKVGQLYQVRKVDPSTPSMMPAVGVILSKSNPTTCIVQLFGEIGGLYTGLAPKSVLYVASNGRPGTTPGTLVQVIGSALSTDVVLIWPDPRVERPSAALVGAINGANTVFTTPEKLVKSSLRVLMNGVQLEEGAGNDYTVTESGGPGTGFDTITFLGFAPRVGDKLFASYLPAL